MIVFAYNIYLKIISCISRDKRMSVKEIRQRWKHIKLCSYYKSKVKKYKWGVSYSVWDGEELLESSIRSLRPSVDYIQVVYQKLSWFGKPASKQLVPLLRRLKKEKLIDELVEFEPDLNDKPGHNEIRKRRLGLKISKKRGLNYFMTIDADEFYIAEELEKAKLYIVANSITHAFCPIVTYFTPILKFDYIPKLYVQFFCKIHWFSNINKNKRTPVICDPTRRIADYPFSKYWVMGNVAMHHMHLIRINIKDKFLNSSYPKAYTNFKNGKYDKYKLIDSDDLFKLIPIVSEWKNN